MSKSSHVEHAKLDQFSATAISGNDILSSALYVSGIAIIYAGIFAPFVLAFIALILFFYKSVYTEVVEALPINGGAYNCLLNGTSKTVAALAGVMTILSYVATAVLSGKVGVEYFSRVIDWPIIPATIGLITVFALLVISGLKDSAKVALAIFSFHVLCLILFVAFGAYYAFHGHSYFALNLATTKTLIHQPGGLTKALFFGFSASLLGVSGFESSANFVEEQQRGVFRKTLRNMLIGIAIFNPLIALVALNSAPIAAIGAAKDFLLAEQAHALGGIWLERLIAIDAFLVLSGAVLTAFVGVSGLVYRMASDAVLPGFLTKENKKGSFPVIVLCFAALCISILLITHGNTLSLAGVYTISFLGVMSLFALGNLLLRETRTELKRTYNAPFIFVVLALLATMVGVVGNIVIDHQNLVYFSMYFLPTIIIVLAIVYQDRLLRFLMRIVRVFPTLAQWTEQTFSDLTTGHFVAFVHHPNRLHQILDYINRNETGWKVTLINCRDENLKQSDKRYNEVKELIPYLKEAGVFPHFDIDVRYYDEPFSPELVDKVSKQLKVRKNRILIGSIHHEHPFEYDEFGGVRIIF